MLSNEILIYKKTKIRNLFFKTIQYFRNVYMMKSIFFFIISLCIIFIIYTMLINFFFIFNGIYFIVFFLIDAFVFAQWYNGISKTKAYKSVSLIWRKWIRYFSLLLWLLSFYIIMSFLLSIRFLWKALLSIPFFLLSSSLSLSHR